MNEGSMITRAALALLSVAGLAGCAAQPQGSPRTADIRPEQPQAAVAAPAEHTLERIDDPSLVCMVNDAYMGRPQIPVVVGGKTYYGCCAMCERRLGSDERARTATDPLTGEHVDKATAVLARTETGAVLYFASALNLDRYEARGMP